MAKALPLDVATFVTDKLGPTPFIVEVGCVLSPEISSALRTTEVLCFDPGRRANEFIRNNLRHIPALMWNRTDAFGKNEKVVQARPLDYYWEEYRFPIDLLICNPKEYARVILGGRRIVFESRYVAVRRTEDAGQTIILDAILPDFKQEANQFGYAMFFNTTF